LPEIQEHLASYGDGIVYTVNRRYRAGALRPAAGRGARNSPF